MLEARNDKLIIAGLNMVLQRIGLSHWVPYNVLRSWAVAPILVTGDRVAVPCAAEEALWIGFWHDDDSISAVVTVTDKESNLRACVRWPESYQLTALFNHSPRPIHREPDQRAREFEVEVFVIFRLGEEVRERFLLYLLESRAWSLESGRELPPELKGPPPLPPRLG